MASWVVVLLIVALCVPLVRALALANELFALRVMGGRVRVTRGRLPQALLDDIKDVLQRDGVTSATLRCTLEGGRPQLTGEGEAFPAATLQRLRNILGQWPVAKIRNAPRRR